MSPIETKELLAGFQAIMLEVLVPLEVQHRIPRVHDHWKKVLVDQSAAQACDRLFNLLIHDRRNVREAISYGLGRREADIILLKSKLYSSISEDLGLIREFFRRPVTDGNEQCPYWDNAAYSERPRIFR